MVEELDKLKKDVEKAVGSVGAEYSYAKDLQNKLGEIERDEPNPALREIRKAFRILRWIGRGERRTDRSEKRIIKELKALGDLLPQKLKTQEEALLAQLGVAEAKLVRAASLFTGEMKDELNKIKTDEQLLKKVQDNKKIGQELQLYFKKTKAGVDELIKWVRSTEALLRQIEGFETQLERLAAA